MNIKDILLLIQQFMWCGLVIIGLQLFLISLKLKEDKIFLLLGLSIILLCMMVGVDLWIILPELTTKKPRLDFINFSDSLYHIFACGYLITAIWLNRFLVNRPFMKTALIHTCILSGFIIGFIYQASLFSSYKIGLHGYNFQLTWIYKYFFIPYIIFIVLWIIVNLKIGRSSNSQSNNHIINGLWWAYILLFLAGLLDIIALGVSSLLVIPSYSQFGVLIMGIFGAKLFSDKMYLLLNSQRETIYKIKQVNDGIKINQPLERIGQSTAIVTEKIMEHVHSLKIFSEVNSKLAPKDNRDDFIKIENVRNNLEKYTKRILEYSNSNKLTHLIPIKINALLDQTLSTLNGPNRLKIQVQVPENSLISVDPNLFGKGLIELINNAWEANSEKIEIRSRIKFGLLSLVIEDFGTGFPIDYKNKILNPFFSLKQKGESIGLGCSIADGIFNAHGGVLRFYPKINNDKNSLGTIANIVLPLVENKNGIKTNKNKICYLISKRNVLAEEFVAICENIGIGLTIIDTVLNQKFWLEINNKKNSLIFLDQENIKQNQLIHFFVNPKVFGIAANQRIFSIQENGNKTESDYLCEDALLHLFSNN